MHAAGFLLCRLRGVSEIRMDVALFEQAGGASPGALLYFNPASPIFDKLNVLWGHRPNPANALRCLNQDSPATKN